MLGCTDTIAPIHMLTDKLIREREGTAPDGNIPTISFFSRRKVRDVKLSKGFAQIVQKVSTDLFPYLGQTAGKD